MSSRAEQKAQLKAAREAEEHAARQSARRRRALTQLGGVLAGAAIVVAVLIAVSSHNASGATKKLAAGAAPAQSAAIGAMFAGIPQQGQVLGRPGAPVTLVEFADLKCPICREFTAQALPTIVQQYVRSGRLRIVFEPQTFVGSPPGDSARAARFALAAGKQDRFWQFADLWYANQQDENTAYATDSYIRQIASGVSGLNATKAFAAQSLPSTTTALAKASTLFDTSGFSGTPSFLLGRTGQTPKALNVSSFDPAQFTGPIDTLLKQ
jgi:protein-disulfide isomerase